MTIPNHILDDTVVITILPPEQQTFLSKEPVIKKQGNTAWMTLPSDLEKFLKHCPFNPAEGRKECCIWQRKPMNKGYGLTRVNKKDTLTHRVSYQQYIGPIPEGLDVCHTCDTMLCVNPLHLRLGTQADNNRDKDLKGRAKKAQGEANRKSKLTVFKVKKIRSYKYYPGLYHKLAAKYGVARTSIKRVYEGNTWKHVR